MNYHETKEHPPYFCFRLVILLATLIRVVLVLLLVVVVFHFGLGWLLSALSTSPFLSPKLPGQFHVPSAGSPPIDV